MTFGDFALGSTGLLVVYYVAVIAADYYRLKRLAGESSGEDQEINISGAVEQFQAVDAAVILGAEHAKSYVDPVDMPDEDDGESKDIDINFQEGIAACDLPSVFASHSDEPSLFEGIITE